MQPHNYLAFGIQTKEVFLFEWPSLYITWFDLMIG